jgi:hypothetical protein
LKYKQAAVFEVMFALNYCFIKFANPATTMLLSKRCAHGPLNTLLQLVEAGCNTKVTSFSVPLIAESLLAKVLVE